MNYRDDARPKCEGCGLPFDETALAFDGEGRRVCKSCSSRDAVARTEGTARIAHARARLARNLVTAAVVLAIVVYLFMLWKQAEPERRREAAERVRTDVRATLEQTYRAARIPDGTAKTQPCDEAALAKAPLPWAEVDLTDTAPRPFGNESPAFHHLVGVLYRDAPSPAELDAMKKTFAGTTQVAIFGWTSREYEDHEDRGTLVIVDLAKHARLCWAPITMPVDRNGSHVEPKVLMVGAHALSTIAPKARLEHF